MSIDLNFKEVPIADINGKKIIETIKVVESAKRDVIAIQDINAFKNQYEQNNIMKTGNLIKKDETIESISIYAEEYIPPHFNKKEMYIEYVLTISGQNYNITPINKEREGVKIIRVASKSYQEGAVMYINKELKDVSLNIIIKTPNKNETPFVSNIKVIKK